MENGERPETVLPDPTADLHWDDFQGAIQDRFCENAVQHPERLCVVETPSTTTRLREFTYRQIHEASNVIAHHFLQHGIERGEVIMIYACTYISELYLLTPPLSGNTKSKICVDRGVDLCLAILGILMAGATFSVIDPAFVLKEICDSKIRSNHLADIPPTDK